MSRTLVVVGCVAIYFVAFVSGQGLPKTLATTPAPVPILVDAHADATAIRSLLDQNCVTCHNQRIKSGGVALDGVDLSGLVKDAAPWERAVRKLRAGMMPPAGSKPLTPELRESFAAGLEAELDRAGGCHFQLGFQDGQLAGRRFGAVDASP